MIEYDRIVLLIKIYDSWVWKKIIEDLTQGVKHYYRDLSMLQAVYPMTAQLANESCTPIG